jgi:predicted MFS family arabinose efflux permease
MQIPLGIALDRYGARRTESFLLLFALCGASIFAYADSLWGLTLGRLLIGIGVSSCLMASFTAYRRWFSIDQQSQLASGMLVFGTAGALLTTIPIQLALPIIGWRGSFWIMAILVAIAFIGIKVGIPKFDDHPSSKKSEDGDQALGFKEIISHPFFLRMLPIGIVNHGGFLALQTLWLGPWMIEVLGFDSIFTAQILFLFNGVMLLGYALNAWLLPRANSRGFKTLNYVKWLLAIGLVSQLLAIVIDSPSGWILWIIVAITATGHILGQSTVITAFPSRNAGVAATSYNLLIFIGAFIFQWGIGWGIDLSVSLGIEKINAFKQVFLFFLFIQLASYLWFLFYPKPLKHHLAGL